MVSSILLEHLPLARPDQRDREERRLVPLQGGLQQRRQEDHQAQGPGLIGARWLLGCWRISLYCECYVNLIYYDLYITPIE